ncbi:tripartite tricarboxylate transporter TctB family protein [Geodermatophilus sp. DSM 44513]|uniref:tripartite tricarboxylate transporter TctB family protein n=1 Tax=Geodermatophilus sp. DSM 44513 TaxID=1528104 RepID=UPI00126BC6C1|nr:tripartite tricarboxylate transporter TctB family protein [Geodermatophilus sp. DSM 44513]WNV74843.1 tripartite tricarboxylate transporter TctB family protein [Geodermatophilus sp. DSM 44513]
MRLQDARKDLLAGAVFTGLGLAFAITSTTYEIGTPLRMGPGFFPLVLGGVLVVLGVSIAVTGVLAREGGDLGTVPWRALVLLIAAILFFGATVRDLGLVPALFVTVLLAALAGRGVRVVPAVVIATSLTALSVLIFVVALQLRLPLIGPWLGG